MTTLQALILGIIQGLTEFLPVSSSGHLVVAELLFNLHISPADLQVFNILLHAGTLAALAVCYAGAWWNMLHSPWSGDKKQQNLFLLIMIATLPAALAGVMLEGVIAQYVQSGMTVGLAFCGTAAVILLGECCKKHKQSIWHKLLHPFESDKEKPSLQSSLFIGLAQAFALVPGISRSGLTVSAGRMMGLGRSDALHFSFLMAVPIIAGASLFAVLEVVQGGVVLPEFSVTVSGVLASFASSVLAILFLRRFVVRHSLSWFAPYLLVMGVVTFVYAL